MKNQNVIEITDTNFDELLRAPLPLLIDFTAAWCAPCRVIKPHVEAIADAYAGRVRVGVCDVDSNQILAARLDVRSMPTLLLWGDGKVLGQIIGAVPRVKIEALVARALPTADAAATARLLPDSPDFGGGERPVPYPGVVERAREVGEHAAVLELGRAQQDARLDGAQHLVGVARGRQVAVDVDEYGAVEPVGAGDVCPRVRRHLGQRGGSFAVLVVNRATGIAADQTQPEVLERDSPRACAPPRSPPCSRSPRRRAVSTPSSTSAPSGSSTAASRWAAVRRRRRCCRRTRRPPPGDRWSRWRRRATCRSDCCARTRRWRIRRRC